MSHFRFQMPETRSVLLFVMFMTVGTAAPWSDAAGQLVWQALPDMPVGKFLAQDIWGSLTASPLIALPL